MPSGRESESATGLSHARQAAKGQTRQATAHAVRLVIGGGREVPRAFIAVVTGLVAAGLVLGAGLRAVRSMTDGTTTAASNSGPESTELHGTSLPSSIQLPNLLLERTDGRRANLQAAQGSRLTLIFTGYTTCPDTCPTTMADVAVALRRLPVADRAKVAVVFVSTDPRRDSPDRIRQWLDRFDPSFVGFRASFPQLQTLSSALRLPVPQDDGTTHSGALMAFERTVGARAVWLTDPSPTDLLADLRVLLSEAS